MQSIAKNTIRFAAFEVDLQSGVMCKHGLRIKLQDQPFKILVALLERPGEIVTRDELRERVWGNETFVDFDHGLSAAVNRLRARRSAIRPRTLATSKQLRDEDIVSSHRCKSCRSQQGLSQNAVSLSEESQFGLQSRRC